MRFLRIKDLEKKISIKRSTIYQKISEGLLPSPRKMGRISYWVDHEIDMVMAAIAEMKPESEVKKIVELINKRGRDN